MPKISKFSARLSAALHIRGMKQVELCARTGIPKSAMSQYVKGTFEPKQDRITAIALALDVNEAWLTGYDDVPMERDGSLPFDPGTELVSGSTLPYRTVQQPENADLDAFLQDLSEEARHLSAENRTRLLELARLFREREKHL